MHDDSDPTMCEIARKLQEEFALARAGAALGLRTGRPTEAGCAAGEAEGIRTALHILQSEGYLQDLVLEDTEQAE